MIFFGIAMGSALFISAIAAWFSITGLVTIFPAAKTSIILMGSSLELAKLVSASWLYRYWRLANWTLRSYFVVAVMVLSFITSIGVFGYLTRAHTEGSTLIGDTADQIALVDKQIAQQEAALVSVDGRLAEMTTAIATLSRAQSTVERSIRVRNAQRAERNALEKQIQEINTAINTLKQQRNTLTAATRKLETEIGPIRYLAELLYDASTTDTNERAVRLMILLLIFVFDPLAILLVIAANMHLAHHRARSTLGRAWNPVRLDAMDHDIQDSFTIIDKPPST